MRKSSENICKLIKVYLLCASLSSNLLPKEYAGSIFLEASCVVKPTVEGRKYRPGPGPVGKEKHMISRCISGLVFMLHVLNISTSLK